MQGGSDIAKCPVGGNKKYRSVERYFNVLRLVDGVRTSCLLNKE